MDETSHKSPTKINIIKIKNIIIIKIKIIKIYIING
jgi:hypothetical protein